MIERPPVSSVNVDRGGARPVEAQLDAVVHEPLALQAVADPGSREQIDRALLEHARADPLLDVLAAAGLDTTDSIPSRCSRWASTSPAGPAPTMPTWVRSSRDNAVTLPAVHGPRRGRRPASVRPWRA